MRNRIIIPSIIVALLCIFIASLITPQIPFVPELMLKAKTALRTLSLGITSGLNSSSSTSTSTSTLITTSAFKAPPASHNMTTSTTTTASLLPHATLARRPSRARGHADHGWLNTYHTFSFASYHDPRFVSFGALRVLNEDRVAPQNGFPTHPHRDAEIFSYVLSGELTHRDSMVREGTKGSGSGDDFFVMKRGDLQFTTGGTGIAHSEYNQHATTPVHFLQIWVTPWRRGLPPTYHTATFSDAAKRAGFVPLISPLAAGLGADAAQEKEARPRVPGTVPIHADFLMGAGIVPPGTRGGFEWVVGGANDGGVAGGAAEGATETAAAAAVVVEKAEGRKVYVHVPMTKEGKTRVRVAGREEGELGEGDGLFVTGVKAGDRLSVENVGDVEAEVVVLDSD